MSLVEQPWWDEFIEALAEYPLYELARRYRVDEPRAIEALLAVSRGGPVTEEPWWPEAVRIAGSYGIRQAARMFATNPRRIRRGLARAGVRVGGQRVGDEGIAALAPFRERLGKEPDHVIAADAKVTVEAVQGERRRLGIDAFRPEPAPRPEPEDTPLPPAADALPPAADALPPAADEPGARKPRRKVVRERRLRPQDAEPAPVVRRPSISERSTKTRVVSWSRLDERRREVRRVVRPEPTPPTPTQEELDAAQARRRERRGRTRIIRPDRITLDDTPQPEVTAPARKRRVVRRSASPHGEVRELSVADIDISEIIPDADKAADAPRVVMPPATAADEPVASDDAPTTPASRSATAPEPEAVAPEALAEPAATETDEAPLAEVIPLFSAPVVTDHALAWQVLVDGQPLPLVFIASSAGEAAARVSDHVAAHQLRHASLRLVGPALSL